MNIQPFQQFYGGQFVQATQIEVTSQFDNLVDSVTFAFKIMAATGEIVGGGTVNLGAADPNGSVYSTWDSSNLGAYKIVCARVGLTLAA